MKKFLIKIGIVSTLILTSLNLSSSSYAVTLGDKNYKIMEINEEFKLFKSSNLIWVNPYLRNDGTSVRGHFRTSPDGYCWNNLSGCR